MDKCIYEIYCLSCIESGKDHNLFKCYVCWVSDIYCRNVKDGE